MKINLTRSKIINIFLFAVVFGVIYLFFFNRLELTKDLPRNICSTGAFNVKMNQTRAADQTLSSVLDYFNNRWPLMPGVFFPEIAFWYALAIPLTQIILSFSFRIFDSSAWTVIFTSSLISSAAILVTFLLGRKMFDRWVGALAAILMASSLFVTIPSRSGYIFFSLEVLNGALFSFILFLAFTRKSLKLLFLSAFLLAVGILNGHSAFVFTMPIFFLILSLSELVYRRKKVFSFFNYVTAAFIGGLSYLLMRFGYGLFFMSSPKESLKWAYLGFVDRQSQIPTFFTKDKFLIDNIERFYHLMFIKSIFGKFGTDAWYLFLPGRPMVSILVSVGLLLGLFYLFLKRDFISKFLLLWFLIPVFIFTVLIHFDARYIMVAAGALFIISALGIITFSRGLLKLFVNITKNGNLRLIANILIIGSLAFLLVKNTADNYNDLYREYLIKKDAMLLREMGLVQAGEYIKNNSRPGSALIVLGDKDSVLPNCVDFGTGIKNYPINFWDNLLFDKIDLAEREKSIFKTKEKIFYVFSPGLNLLTMPGINLYPAHTDFISFYSLHPGLQPIKEIKFSTGIPAIDIYDVNRQTLKTTEVELDDFVRNQFKLRNISDSQPLPLKIKGPVKNLTIGSSPSINSKVGQTLFVSYSTKDNFLIEPLAEYGASQVFAAKNVLFQPGEEGVVALETDGEGYIIFKIDAPGNINEVEVVTNPKFFNDSAGKNNVAGFTSLDGKSYKQFFRVESDKTNDWTYGRTTYHRFFPDANTFYIKFLMNGEGKRVKFWLNKTDPISIRAKIDTSNLEKFYKSTKLDIISFDIDRVGTISGSVKILVPVN